jgi:hypothetical protein
MTEGDTKDRGIRGGLLASPGTPVGSYLGSRGSVRLWDSAQLCILKSAQFTDPLCSLN